MSQDHFRYSIVDINSTQFQHIDLINKCYQLWKEVYEPIHAEAKQRLEPDAFYKAKFLAVIHDDNNIPLAFCTHNVLDMRLLDIDQIGYFKGSSEPFLQLLRNEKHLMLTVEWVTVRPQDRVRFSKLQYYDVIIALNNRLLQMTNFTAAMGFSRMDLKVDRMLSKFGHKGYGEVLRHDIPCQIMMIKPNEIKPHPFKIVEQTADELWAKRNIQSAYVQQKEIGYEKAS